MLGDSGEVEQVDVVEGHGEDGPNAVLMRRREFRGWSGRNRVGAILTCWVDSRKRSVRTFMARRGVGLVHCSGDSLGRCCEQLAVERKPFV